MAYTQIYVWSWGWGRGWGESEAPPVSELDKNGDTKGRGEGYGTNLRGKAKKKRRESREACELQTELQNMNIFASEWMNEPASEWMNEWLNEWGRLRSGQAKAEAVNCSNSRRGLRLTDALCASSVYWGRARNRGPAAGYRVSSARITRLAARGWLVQGSTVGKNKATS